jgi:tetratricopeptide (TPR) repeat protein
MPRRLLPRHLLSAVFVILVVSALILAAQTRPTAQQPGTPADAALRALNLGHYDEVEQLLRNQSDPRSIALRARAHRERGRYAEAEKLLTAPAAAAPPSDAALELGLLQMQLGKRPDARRTLERILGADARTAADYMRIGNAARALGEFDDANRSFREANRLAPDDPDVNTAWGELLLEKYNRADAMKSFQIALRVNEDNVAARIGLARVALEENPPAAKTAVERALKTNPSYVPAHLLAAEMAMDDRRRDEAKTSIKAALDVNPNSLEARALDGAIAFLEGRSQDFTRKSDDILKINPKFGEVYRVAGDHAARNYRFDEAAELVRKALSIDPDNSRAYSDLGMHLLRTGDEPGARQALERSFKDDPYDVVTHNLLEMLDKVDKFETVKDGDLIVRLDPEEAGVMREQVLPLAKEALARLSQLWDFKPTGPILIEMFPKHDDFAVRNVGLPGMIGALGACFGRVVTLDSPHARKPGEYNWQPTLWHELAHVITLQMSNQRVPRWLTEGISVWEEKRGRPEWGREMDVTFAHAMDENKVLKLDVLNEGFQDPRMISLAYYEASLLVDHIVERFGEQGLRKMLRAYGRGLETDDALKDALNVSMDDLQKSFDARLEKDYAPVRKALSRPKLEGQPPSSVEEWKKFASEHPDSFPVQMGLAQALHKAGDTAAAIQTYERASQLLPLATGDDNPNKAIAAIAIEKGDNARAVQALEAVVKVDHSDVEAARKLTSLLTDRDAQRAEDAYRRLVAIDPFDAAAQSRYGRLLLQRKNAPDAVRAFRSALASNPPDRAAAHLDLAEAYVTTGQLADAKRETLAALEIAPSFERAQDLLLKIVDAGAAPK